MIIWGRVVVKVKSLISKRWTIVEFCRDCGCKQPLVWQTTDAMWDRYSGFHGPHGILCPECFTRRAGKWGHALMWRCEVMLPPWEGE